MSGTSRKQRQKKNNERIIPIQIEKDDPKPENIIETVNNEEKITNAVTIGSLSPSTDISEDDLVLVDKLELSESIDNGVEAEDIIKIPVRMLPSYNVPEKIVIILDRAEDEVSTFFELNNGSKLKPLDMLKDALKFFLNNKNAIDNKHEFALVTLNENSASWAHDFTSNVQNIIQELNDVEECETEDIFDMGTVFDLINKNVTVPTPKADLIIPPPFVVRAIFLYNRSITMPQIKLTEEISDLLTSPYFTFDVTMTHEIPDSSNKCNLIFKELQQLDTKGFAFFFPVSRSPSLLYVAMAKLLSHPLQRCAQKDANYKLNCA